MNKILNINGTKVGGERTYIIAEAGSNHNGSLKMAKELIDAAVDAKVDAVKFQAFKAKYHYSKYTPGFDYLNNAATYELIKSLEINRKWHEALIRYSEERGITFLSSPADSEAIEQLAELNISAFKVASFDLPDINLIKIMARYNKPIILSTGLANYSDIQAAVDTIKKTGNDQIILLQCTSLYPAPAHLSNLAAITTLKKAFAHIVGYSDHTIGDHIPIAAVALGAKVIEKHFTLDRTLPGPDHSFAIEPNELKKMVDRIREVELSIGDGMKNGPRDEELEMFKNGRRSIHVTRTLKAGEKIAKENVIIKRPGYGISPLFLENIIGMELKKEVKEDKWLQWEDFK